MPSRKTKAYTTPKTFLPITSVYKINKSVTSSIFGRKLNATWLIKTIAAMTPMTARSFVLREVFINIPLLR